MNGMITVNPIDISGAKTAQTQATLMLDNAQQTVIQNQGTYEQAAFFLKTVKEKYKQLDIMRKSITKPLDDSKAQVMNLFRPSIEMLEQAESIIKRSMITYEDEQERIRREQELKLQQEAARKQREALQKAEAARASGNESKAEKYENRAAAVVAPVLAARVNGVQGIARKKVWKYRVDDVNAIPREYMIPNEKLIGDVVRSSKGAIQIPGITAYPEDIISAGK